MALDICDVQRDGDGWIDGIDAVSSRMNYDLLFERVVYR